MVRLAGKVRGNGLVEMMVVMVTVKRGRDGRKMMISCSEGKDEKEISHRERRTKIFFKIGFVTFFL